MTDLLEAEYGRGDVLVVEDDQVLAHEIAAEVKKVARNVKVVEAGTTRDAFDRIRSTDLDAASVDLQLGAHRSGRQVLEKLRTDRPVAGRVLYTQFDKEGAAVSKDVAAVLAVKVDPAIGSKIDKAIRLGMARRIANTLKQMGERVPNLSESASLEVRTERDLLDLSRDVAIRECIKGQEPSALLDSLEKRGWWRSFSQRRYLQLSHSSKLRWLLQCVDPPARLIAPLVGASIEQAGGFLAGGALEVGEETLTSAQRRDQLLSVMAYLLRLSGNRPELMRHFWSGKTLFSGSTNPPPWDTHGLVGYLDAKGPEGLEACLTWIRSH